MEKLLNNATSINEAREILTNSMLEKEDPKNSNCFQDGRENYLFS